MEDGKVCLQRSNNGSIVGWDVFELDASFVGIRSKILRKTGDPVILGYETEPGSVAIGDVLSVLNWLNSNNSDLVLMRENAPHSYDALQDFRSEVEAMNLPVVTRPVLEEASFGDSSVQTPPIVKNEPARGYCSLNHVDGKAQKVDWLSGCFNSSMHRYQSSHFAFVEVNNLIRFAESKYAEPLINEAELLLGQRLLAQKAVTEVFSKLREQIKIFALPNLDVSSIRHVYRSHVFEILSSIKTQDSFTERKYSDVVFSEPSSFSRRGGSQWEEWYSNALNVVLSAGNDNFHKFRQFQANYPQEACLFYWIYHDNLSFDGICQIVDGGPDHAMEILRRGRSGLQYSLYREADLASMSSLDIHWFNPIRLVSDIYSDGDKSRHLLSGVVSSFATGAEEMASRELEATRKSISSLFRTESEEQPNPSKGFPVSDLNSSAFTWKVYSKGRPN
jgi:hypothetical protein